MKCWILFFLEKIDSILNCLSAEGVKMVVQRLTMGKGCSQV